MLKSNVSQKFVDSYEKYTKNIDYLRYKISGFHIEKSLIKFFDSHLLKLDFDNSGFSTDELFGHIITFQKLSLSTGPSLLCMISYFDTPVPVFLFNEFHESNKNLFKGYGRFDIYGSYYRLLEIGYISNDFNNKLSHFFSNSEITRLDWRIDGFTNDKTKNFIDPPKKFIKIRKNSCVDPHLEGTVLKSWSVGSKLSKRYIVRLYDKLRDSNKKGKMFLYGDYFDFENVHRLEFQYMNHFCKGFIGSQLDLLLKKISDHTGGDFKGNLFYTYQKLDLTNTANKLRYCRITKGYLNQLSINKINLFTLVYDVYRENGISDKKIKSFLKDSTAGHLTN